MEKRIPWENTDSFADIKKFLSKVLRRWHWMGIALFWTFLIAFLINRYNTPVYQVNAAIITKKFDENQNSLIPGLVKDNLFQNRIEVYQEIPLLKSPQKIRETIHRLDFEEAYFVEGNVKTTEVYPCTFFEIELDTSSSNIPYQVPVYIHPEDGNSYTLSSPNPNWNKIFRGQTCHYDQSCSFKGLQFTVYLRREQLPNPDYHYYFVLNNPENLVSEYRDRLQISWRQQGSAILNLSMRSPLPQKDIDFLNEYIKVVIAKNLIDKNEQATNTINFIDGQMQDIGDTLLNFLVQIDSMKLEDQELTNGSEYVFEKLKELDQEKAEHLMENRYYDYLERYLHQKRYDEVFAPDLIGLDAPLLNQFINQFVSLKLEDKVDKNTLNEKNPLVIREDEKTDRLVGNIFESINNLKQANQQAIHDINTKINFYFNSLKDLQVESRELTRLQKLFTYNESLYTLLLQKKTEASIAKASTTSDYQIVEPPNYNPEPVSPDKNKNYLIALLVGLGLPISLIYLSDLLNDKIVTREDLQKITSIPVLGHIGHSSLKTNLVIKKSPKSIIAESFRTIRANLQYFIGMSEKSNSIFMVTSSISDEGKTFCSINLAQIFALSGKKTLLLGADMRKPSLPAYLGMRDLPGLSNYLGGFNTLDEIIVKQQEDNLDIILGGDIPPNPAELLASEKMRNLMDKLKREYEYIIVDTTPIGLVSDALELLKMTDFNLLVVRQGKTVKSALGTIDDLFREGKIKNIGILFNDVDFRKLDYGYGYRYGYTYRYGYYYRYGYGYGKGYFDEENKKKRWFGFRRDRK